MADTPKAAPSLVSLIDPRDNRIYSVSADRADAYRHAGWGTVPAQPTIDADEIQNHLSGWYDNGQAVAFTIARGVPLAVKSLSKVVDANTFQNLAAKARIFDEDHPVVSTALQLAGGVGSGIAIASGVGAVAGAAGGVLGLGAEAAGVGAEAAGVGAAAADVAGTAAGTAGAAGAGGAGAAAAGAAEGAVGAAGGAAGGAAETGAATVGRYLTAGSEGAAGELGAGEQVAGRLTSGAKQLGTGLREPIVEDATGLIRTNQMVPRSGIAAEAPIEAEFAEGAAPQAGTGGVGSTAGEATAAGEAGTGGSAGSGGAGSAAEASPAVDPATVSNATGEAAANTNFRTTLGDLLAGAKGKVGAVGKVATIGALENAAYGQAYKIDNQAIEHAMDPQGQEKLMFSANDVLWDAVLGAALPVGLSGLAKGIGKTGKKITDGSIEMFRKAVLKGSSLDAIAAQGRMGTLYTTLDPLMGQSGERIANTTRAAVETAEQGMNIIKAKYKGRTPSSGLLLNPDEKMAILDGIEKIVGTKNEPVWNEAYAALAKDNVDLQALQKLGKKLGKKIVWKDEKFAENATNILYRDARDVVSKAQRDLLERADITGAGDAERWARLNQTSSDNQLIYDAIRDKGSVDSGVILNNIATSAVAGAAASAFGVGGAGILASGLKTGAWGAVRSIKAQHIAPFANALGKTMLKVDGKIAKTIEAGLYGFPGQVHKFTNQIDYDNAAAAVSLAGADPAATIANIQNHHNEQGIPQEISVPVTQMQAAGLSHLKDSIPGRNDAPDMATRSTGDPVQQHRWLEQVRTFQDPTYGIANPTADNLRILKQFYPQTLFTAQQALYQQIAKNPDLPAEARAWGSKLMERPIGNLDSPTFAQTLSQARQAQAKAAAEGAKTGKPGSGGGSSSGVESSETRVDQLQNRG